jgi:hypothetical protein
MGESRLLNCKFVNASSFKVNISNKAKLLYLFMFSNADDKGFVDTTNDLINALTDNEKVFNNTISLELLENTYTSALNELIDKGYIYEFSDKHNNKIHLIRHWFLHNHYKQGLWTNYKVLLGKVYLENGEYELGKKPFKENNINKVIQNNVNQNKVDKEEWDKLMNSIDDKPKESDDDYPFEVDYEISDNNQGQ